MMIGFYGAREWSAIFVTAVNIGMCGCGSRPAETDSPGTHAHDLVAVEGHQLPIVDSDYCFRIQTPGRDWKLLSEREVQRILPDAVAGAVSAGGCYGVVIAEPLPTRDLQSYVQLLEDNFALPNSQLYPQEEANFQGQPAIRYGQKANVNGIDVSYDRVVFEYQHYGYQLVCWAISTRFSKDEAQRFFDAFEIVDGQVQGRANAPVSHFEGVGQRVVDGRFESPVFRLVVQPEGDWQLMVGHSLIQSNPDAEVGLANAARNAYFIIIPEYVFDVDHDAYRRDRISETEFNLGISAVPNRRSSMMNVDGSLVEFHSFVTDSPPFRYYSGLHFEDDVAYQLLAWHVNRDDDGMLDEIKKAIDTVHFMDRAASDELAGKMLAQPDPENLVGPGYSLRNGRYRDFHHGLEWTKPKGFWRVTAGDAARAYNEACSVFATEPRAGVFLQLINEDAGGLDSERYHQSVLENMFGPRNPVLDQPPQMVTLRGAVAQASEAELSVDGNVFLYRVVSVVVGGDAHQMILWGFPEVMKKAATQVDDAISGLSFPGPELVEIVRHSASIRDNRLGFEIRLPERGWSMRDDLRPDIKPMGNFVQFQRRGQSLLVMAVASPEAGQDLSWGKDMIGDMLQANSSRLANSPPQETNSTLGGMPCTVQTWQGEQETIRTLVILKARTVFGLILVDSQGDRNSLFQLARSGFRLLD